MNIRIFENVNKLLEIIFGKIEIYMQKKPWLPYI